MSPAAVLLNQSSSSSPTKHSLYPPQSPFPSSATDAYSPAVAHSSYSQNSPMKMRSSQPSTVPHSHGGTMEAHRQPPRGFPNTSSSAKKESFRPPPAIETFIDEGMDRRDILTAAAVSNEAKGLCIQCGTQLYQIVQQKKGLFQLSKSKEVKVPLSIPGQVERGHCLQCGIKEEEDVEIEVKPHPRSNGSISPDSFASSSEEPEMNRPSVASLSHTPSQSKASYQGSFNVYGERDGPGVMTWENGDVYTGEFFNGNRHGHGTLVFADGTEYVGEWECNLQHGVGTRRWTNGDCYTGQYRNGKRTGEGRFYYSNGDMYIGQWVSGVMHGPGRYYYASGQRFEGIFVNGKRQGKGKLQRTDGSLDVGVYIQDVRRGIGVRWSADRTLAWKMFDGAVKKKITIPEAVAMDYDIDAAAQAAMDASSSVV